VARILVVDDDQPVREMICSILDTCGYKIAEAANGNIAISMYREQPFDVVITDLVMPDMEGIELIKELRAIDRNVKVIAISGGFLTASDTYLKAAKLMGAQRTLPKPFEMDELLSVVSSVLEET
jgi:two-component system, chemotaxis family, chemotaxis protein CheY